MDRAPSPEGAVTYRDDDRQPPRPDTLQFGAREGETFEGSGGIDLIDSGGGDDVVTRTDARANLVLGGSGGDLIYSTGVSDLVIGGSGDDVIRADGSQAIVFGGTGSDTIDGSDTGAIDLLCGGGGGDWLSGGEGSDTLTGGAGADTFAHHAGHGIDRITDFTDGEDAIALDTFDRIAGLEDLTVTQAGTNVTIDLSEHGGGTLTLENLALDALDETDFVLCQSAPAEPVQDGL